VTLVTDLTAAFSQEMMHAALSWTGRHPPTRSSPRPNWSRLCRLARRRRI